MAGTELLLQKIKEWGKYAHKGVTMSNEGERLTELCGRWRKEELEGWSRLIIAKDFEWSRRVASQMWFRMYKLLVLREGGGEQRGKEEMEGGEEREGEREEGGRWDDEELTWLFEFLSEFIEGAKVGDFPVRHSMLAMFGYHLYSKGVASQDLRERFFFILFLFLFLFFFIFFF